jgi:aminopeptidase N
MKTVRLVVSCLISLLFTLSLTAQINPDFQWELDDLICKEQEKASFHIHERGLRNPFSDRTDIFYQNMKWEINPAEYYIKGEITYHFKSKIDNLTELHLDLSNDLSINSIVRGNTALTFLHSNDQLLTISLGQSLSSGETDSLTVSYEGMPPSNGFGSFEQGTHDNQPIIWTLSEPYGVRDWWPGKQDLVDKIDSVDIFITTPPGQLAASNGKLISITEQNGKLIHHWQHRHPIASYLVALAVTNYASYSQFVPLDNGDSIEILNYVYPETLSQTMESTKNSKDIMILYNELFGTYPFADEKYGHAQFGWGGGMEHQTMSFMGGFSFGLQAHEMAHQWFGDKVTCGSWTEIWLNEGFATYLTGLTLEAYSPLEYWPLWKISTTNSATSQPGGSVFVDDTTSVNRIFSGRLTYNKGAYLLHMLRWVVGDEFFFQSCRDYLNNPGTAYDFGTTEELQGYLESNSGKALDEFFEDWYYGQGFPSYQLNWQEKQDSVIFEISQTPSHESVSFFEMPLPVRIYSNGTTEEFILDHKNQGERFAFHTGDIVIDSVHFDPDRWILSRNNVVTDLTTSTGDVNANEKYKLYPNPAGDYILLPDSDAIHHAELINAQGQTLRTEIVEQKINVTDIPSGFYAVRLTNIHGEQLSIQHLLILH